MTNPFSIEQKLFSVLTPVYKQAYKQLDKFITTLNEQEYRDFELVVVFDGKNARGEQEIKRLKDKFSLDISWYTIEHGGAPKARNYAASKAKGDYYTFLDPDVYLYPGTFRIWANAFEERPDINRVWGMYDVLDENGNAQFAIGSVPTLPNGNVWYGAFKYQNYCSGAFPIRKEVCPKWGEDIKSLQDWDLMIQMLEPTFEGKDMLYIGESFFATEYPHDKGISADSHRNWIDRTDYIRNKHNLPKSDIVVTSLGAPFHGIHTAEKLGADYLPMPSFKEHMYKMIYLLGFYTQEDPNNPGLATRSHMQVFDRSAGKAKKEVGAVGEMNKERASKTVNVIHWIGSDIMQLRWNCSFEKIKALKSWFKKNRVVHLCEADFTRKELAELGIKAKVIPIPPQKLYEPMVLPEKFSVAIYNNASAVYDHDLMMSIVRSMPDIQFYFFGNEGTKGTKDENLEHLGFVDLDEWMPKFSCNVRVTKHDGLPITPLQFLTAGRNVVTNVPLKGVIKCDLTRETIVKGIREAQGKDLKDKVSRYWRRKLDFKKYQRKMRRLM